MFYIAVGRHMIRGCGLSYLQITGPACVHNTNGVNIYVRESTRVENVHRSVSIKSFTLRSAEYDGRLCE
jgi:hypothetical protein